MRIQGIDLLRGLAVGLVILHHALPGVFPGSGVVGVVMFFALSGYLITGVLGAELHRTGRVDLRRFYRRRGQRLLPALLALLVVFSLVTLTIDPLDDRDELLATLLFALTWTGNLPFGHASDATFHFWTLATEEQFYLFWPALLVFGAYRRKVGLVVGLTGLASAVACLGTVYWLRAVPDNAYALPTPWAGCFVIGAVARIYGHRWWDRVRQWDAEIWLTGPALAVLALLSVIPLRGHALTYLVGGPVIALLTVFLLLSWKTWTEVNGQVLTAVVRLGTISYGAYLWNYPLTLWLRPHLDAGAGVLAAVLTLGCAAASWYLVELPVARWGTRSPVRNESPGVVA